ncbi:MAG: hypothetical protein AAGA58_10325 [Verrucomicrobiota bacterium]
MTALASICDFKDWIGPMVVKELRQGLRAKSFIGVFLGLQAMLVIITATMADAGGSNEAISMWFWGFINLVFIVIMPLRGFNTISQEARHKTLELVLMTRLDARRITYGKWFALYAQTLLFSISLLPFVIMRFFLGGVELATEIYVLILFTINSGALTALSVGVSAQPSALLRGAAALGIVFSFFPAQGILVQSFVYNFGSSMTLWASTEFWASFGTILLISAFVTLFMIDFGAGYIAPDAQNISTRKRLLTIGFVFLLLGFCLIPTVESRLMVGLALVFASIPCIDALCERPAAVASLYTPFVRRGFLGRLLGRFFYPGWQSGFFFALLISGAIGVFFYLSFYDPDPELRFLIAIVSFGVLIFPVAIIQYILPKTANPFVLYILIQLVTLAFCFAFLAIDNSSDSSGILPKLSFIPWASLIVSGNDYNYDAGKTPLITGSIATGVLIILLMGKALPIFRQIGQLEKVVADQLAGERKTLDG